MASVQVISWTLAPSLAHNAPPLDVVEGYMWGREWVLATYKHPALPSWALEASRRITGAIGWPAYLISQACVATTYLCVYLLGRELMGASRAAAGTLLLTAVAFFAWPTTEFNHNLAETPIWAALAWALWHAVERPGTWRWVLIGALAALGMYAKFSTALLLTTMAAWLLLDARARAGLYTRGPWVCLITFGICIAPLVRWLFANDFAPLHYAALRATGGRGGGVSSFILNELLNLIGMGLVLFIAGLIGPSPRTVEPAAAQPAPVDPRATAYLATLTFGPLAIAVIGALICDANLKSAWGSSMFNLAGLLAVALTTRRFAPRALNRIAASAAAVLVLVPIGYALLISVFPHRLSAHMRVSWPQAAISRRMTAIWTRQTGQPLRIVGGDDWIAGLVGISARDEPSLLSKGERGLSPWISAERLERQGMLIVWDASRERIAPALQPLVAARTRGEEHFTWPDTGGDLTIGYVIVAPNSAVR